MDTTVSNKEVKLLDEDPTVFGKCLSCSRTGRGVITGNWFAKAYPKGKWAKNPVCDNCGGPLVELYRVE